MKCRQAVKILPNRVFFRGNLAVYAAYAGDFQTAEREARAVEEPNDLATLALAFAQSGQGLLSEATDTYRQAQDDDPPRRVLVGIWSCRPGVVRGSNFRSRGTSGAGGDCGPDVQERRSSGQEARRRWPSRISCADVQCLPSPRPKKRFRTVTPWKVRFMAARIFVEAGAIDKAGERGGGLASALPAEPQAYGKILRRRDCPEERGPAPGDQDLSDANSVLDTWVGHFDLGRAYLEAGALPQADSEFDRCIQRRGEALSLLVDEEPTYGDSRSCTTTRAAFVRD